MPCTTSRVSWSTRMATSGRLTRLLGQLDRLPRRLEHRRRGDDPGVRGLLEDPPSLLGVGPVEPNHDGYPGIDPLERLDDALGHQLPPRDAAEDVHQDAADRWIGEDDLE